MPGKSTATKAKRTKPHKSKATKAEGTKVPSWFYRGGEPTWDVAALFPAQGTWRESDYFALEGFRDGVHPLLELVNGHLEVLPMPTELHQFIMLFLVEVLRAYTQVHAPGAVLCAGMKVRLRSGAYREPDVLYIKAEHAHRRRNEYWEGADLVMEIVSSSPKDRQRDLEEKRLDYARARIPEYWLIDPEERWIRVLTLKGRTYRVHGEFGPGAQATSVLLPGFAVAVDTVLAPPGSQQVRSN
jgi:Uma2 family endonuclease